MHDVTSTNQSQVISYRTLRKIVGVLGLTFPIVLFVGAYFVDGEGVQSSISSYYHTGMRDVFVGTLCVIGFFLLSYRGHERRDDWAGNIACVSVLFVAFVPTTPDNPIPGMSGIIGTIHLTFAAIFFATLIYFSLVLFTKSNPTVTPTRRKKQRNYVYRGCGFLMTASILLIVLFKIAPDRMAERIDGGNPVYWLEAIAIIAFGLSWLTKGRALLNNKPDD